MADIQFRTTDQGNVALENFLEGPVSLVDATTSFVLTGEGTRIIYDLRQQGSIRTINRISLELEDPLNSGTYIAYAHIVVFGTVLFTPTSWSLGLLDSYMRLSDTMRGSEGDDQITNYTLAGYDQADTLFGNGGNDLLWSRQSGNILDGGADDDTIRLTGWAGAEYRVSVKGGEGFDTLEIAARGTYEFTALEGIERLVFTDANSGFDQIVQFGSDQIEGLSDTLAIASASRDAIILIVRTPGAAADLDLSGWTFEGWNSDAAYGIDIDLTDDGVTVFDDRVIGTIMGDNIAAGGGADSLDGGEGDDRLAGDSGADTIRGGAGNDMIEIAAGDLDAREIIDGGEGVDTLLAVGNNDFSDVLIAGIERVVIDQATNLTFGAGLGRNATFVHEGGAATRLQVHLSGAAGLDLATWSFQSWRTDDKLEIVGSSGADLFTLPDVQSTISGGGGLDILVVDHSQRTTPLTFDFSGAASKKVLANGTVLESVEAFNLSGGSGSDNLTGGLHGDTLSGGAGRDILAGGADADMLGGGSSADILDGGDGNDWLDGGSDADLLDGGLGNDTYVVSGSDMILDAGGHDTVLVDGSFSLASVPQIEDLAVQSATSVNAVALSGNAGANALSGNAGANTLQGLNGNDWLQASAGNDRLIGGAGNDRLSGGSGKDTFEFNSKLSKTSNVDVILDFRAADDTIRLDDAQFKGVKRGKLAKDAFWLGKKAADAQDRVIYDKKAGALYYDPDGTGSAKQILFAELANKAAVSHLDFLIV